MVKEMHQTDVQPTQPVEFTARSNGSLTYRGTDDIAVIEILTRHAIALRRETHRDNLATLLAPTIVIALAVLLLGGIACNTTSVLLRQDPEVHHAAS